MFFSYIVRCYFKVFFAFRCFISNGTGLAEWHLRQKIILQRELEVKSVSSVLAFDSQRVDDSQSLVLLSSEVQRSRIKSLSFNINLAHVLIEWIKTLVSMPNSFCHIDPHPLSSFSDPSEWALSYLNSSKLILKQKSERHRAWNTPCSVDRGETRIFSLAEVKHHPPPELSTA